MKEIALLSHLFMEFTDSIPADPKTALHLTKAAHENRKKVIVGALFVEREIEALIAFYVVPTPESVDQREFITAEILGSDAVSFAAKKRLIMSLVNQKGWLQGTEKSAFEKNLKDVISYRNAFTHGNMIVLGSVVSLEYFAGNRRKVELSDEYWASLESTFRSVVSRLEAVKTAAGMPTATSDAANPV